LQCAALVAFIQLAGATAMKGPFVGAVTCAAIARQDALDFAVGAGYHVNTDQFTNAPRSRRACVCCCLYGTDVTAHENRYVTGADIFFSNELNVCSLDHRVGGLYGADKAFGLDHSECFERHIGLPLFFLLKVKTWD
jgi:hypothetical protein